MFELGGYKTVLEGLQNTLIIALGGFLIGLILGILLAVMQLLPESKLTKILSTISKLYVGLFRGTIISKNLS